jgi:predicted phage terminase large subunit-like protein
MGIGGSLTGKHFDRIFTDDIVNVKDRVSRAEREHTKLIYQELQNIKNRGGRIFNTGTPWHKEDCFELMPNAHKWDCYSTGLMSDAEIEDIRSHMLSSLFAANYELQHIASEDVIFANPHINADIELAKDGFTQVDCAYDGADYTALTICHKIGDKYYIFGKLWGKHCEDCEDEIIRIHNEFASGKLYNETNADKGFFAKKLRARGVRVVTYAETMNKFLKISSYLRDEWDNVYFVKGTDKAYIEQICEYNEEAEHDDAPDSLASAIRVKWRKQSNYIPIWSC